MPNRPSPLVALVVAAAAGLTACAGGYYDDGYYRDGGYPRDGRYDRYDRHERDGRYDRDGRHHGGRDAADDLRRRNEASQQYREQLRDRVRAAMIADRRLGPSIVVDVREDGTVALSGMAAGGIQAHGLAVDTARRVPGVRNVINGLSQY
jgi:hypothetical protein